MPCTGGGPSDEQEQEPKRLAACLCAVLTHFEERDILSDMLDAMDWREAGVTKEWLVGWWAEHKRADAQRREAERQAEETRIRQTHALSKLTPEERRLLGLR